MLYYDNLYILCSCFVTLSFYDVSKYSWNDLCIEYIDLRCCVAVHFAHKVEAAHPPPPFNPDSSEYFPRISCLAS